MKKFLVAGLRHMQKRYYWRDLEPTKDSYNFTELASDIAWCAANGCLLTAMIQDKTFGPGAHPLPHGMEALELVNHAGTAANPDQVGLTGKRWDAAYVTQFNKLTAKLAQFDGQPGFNGVATCETSLSLDQSVLKANGYTPELYKASYINTLIAAAKNLPRSNIYWTMNFFVGNQAYIGDIVDAVRPYGVQMGGPDCLPNSASLLTAAYPFYAQFKGRIRLFIQVSPPGYAVPDADGPGKFLTMTDIFNFAKDTLFVNTMFWYPIAQPSDPSKGYGWNDAVPVIAANPIINP
jgi:hypothetical protein